MMTAELERKTVKPAPLWDEVQATAAARYNLEVILRHVRGEITTEQFGAFLAPMQPQEEILAQLRALPDEQFDAMFTVARQEGFSTTLITRERRNRKRRAARAATAARSRA